MIPISIHTKHVSYRISGFSLLEIVIAMAIIAGGLVAVIVLFPSAQKLMVNSAANANVTNLARTELSKVRVGGALSTGLSYWEQETTFQMLDSAESAYSLYQNYGSITSRVPIGKGLYRVTFRVLLNDGREERFVTYVTEIQ